MILLHTVIVVTTYLRGGNADIVSRSSTETRHQPSLCQRYTSQGRPSGEGPTLDHHDYDTSGNDPRGNIFFAFLFIARD